MSVVNSVRRRLLCGTILEPSRERIFPSSLAVHRTAAATGRRCRRSRRPWLIALALAAGAGPAFAQTAPAGLPSGGAFVRGSGAIDQPNAAVMNITQTSPRGVIDWRAFSIDAGNQVNIDNATGATLNRVLGGQLSRIQGQLNATGSVYLMNPHGVVVGPNGVVATGGSFVASTRAIDPGAFMERGALVASGNSRGEVVNAGTIQSERGSVVLIGQSVSNQGTIRAANGRVSLTAADRVLMTTTDGRAENIYVAFAGGGDGDVTQSGRIAAAAVAIQAAGGNVFALAGNRDGLVQATGTTTVNGELWLTAPEGRVEVEGRVAARNADGSGGEIAVTGREVQVAASADISAAGTRGGEVLVGTPEFGRGTGLAASTVIESGATIRAGGPDGGGRIETSGRAMEIGAARIEAGDGGHWLLDPNDITIDTALASTITTSLDAGTDVTQQTTSGGTGGVGDITVAAPVIWTGTGDLTLDAFRNIAVNQVIDGGGNVTLISAGSTTIGAAGSLASTGDVTVTAASFVNQGGAAALSAGGRWLVYSGDPANDTTGGLVPDFYQYDAPGGSTPANAGNGLLYSAAPTIDITLGTVSKTYDGTTTAFLDDSNTTVTGLINDDDWTLDGLYETANAGTGITVTADNFQATHSGIPVFGYDVTTPVTADTGEILRAVLTAAIVGTPTKTYNATTAVSLTPANFELTGVVSGESITIGAAATAAYDSPNAGDRIVNATFTTPNFTAGAGTSLDNYILPTSATGDGLINPASLNVTGVTADDKVYDSTTVATIDTSGLSIFGIVDGDDVAVDSSSATGTFATKNVGNAIPVTASGFALTGADAANYLVSDAGGLAANITPATITVTGLTAVSKVYDGTTTATLDLDDLEIDGIFAGDDVTPQGGGAQVNFTTRNAGVDIPVSITGVTVGGADAGNYNLAFAGDLSADITPRPLTVSVIGNPTRVYDGTTDAPVVQANAQVDNVVTGESISVTQASGASYASKNAGSWLITATLAPSDYVAGANTLLSNYLLPTTATGLGTIDPAPLDVVIVGNPTKPYDGNADASLGPDNFEVDGFVPGEGATVTETEGEYASANAGVWTVTVDLDEADFDPDPGTLMSNYVIPSPVFGPGTIIRRDLGPGVVNVDITGNPTKIYDGNTIATLTPDDYTLSGFIPGEGATVTETTGEYAAPDAGPEPVLVLLEPDDFLPDPGTNLDNYNLPSEATGIGLILRRPLGVSITGNPTKVYNGTTIAFALPDDYTITGFVAGESATVSVAVTETYDSRNAGSRTVTASLLPSDFIFASNTRAGNYLVPNSATGPGTITPAPLTVLNAFALDKVYDQTTSAQIDTSNVALFGVVSGDSVSLVSAAANGTFAQSGVGNNIAVTTAGFAVIGADIGNYTLFQPSGLAADITPRPLALLDVVALDKFYDATTLATLDLDNTVLDGVLSGDDVDFSSAAAAAAFLQANVGTDLRVNVGGFALTGADSGNYSLSQPSGLTADINPVTLTGAIVGNPTKTYDGTTQVSLTAANYSLTGFVAGEGGDITQSAGAAYNNPNAGARIVTANLVVSDFVADPGTLLSNYVLPTSITGPGTINRAQLLASIVGNPTKVYDNTTAATLTSANFALSGFVSGQSATVTETAGLYDTDNAGSRIVTSTLAAGDFTAGSGTLLSNYLLPTTATGPGTITPAQVQVINVLAQDKVYDGTTIANLLTAAAALSGVFAGDTVNVVSTAATGTFADPDVGTDIPVTAAGFTIAGADAGNYTVLQPVGLLADIFEATLQIVSVTKVYDADFDVPSVNSAYVLSGIVAGDSVSVNASVITGAYASKNVGTGILVDLQNITLTGADAGNYTIGAIVNDGPIGIITPAQLNIIGVLALDKTYDQNALAQLDNDDAELQGILSGPLGTDQVVLLVNGTTGTFLNAVGGSPDPNAGVDKPVSAVGYTISGADAGNYNLIQPQGVTATINPLQIFLTSVVRIYDGTTAVPTASSGYGFTGILAGDNVVAQTSGVTGNYADRNVGGTLNGGVVTNGINVTLTGLTLSGAQAGNYFVDPGVTSAPIGVITPRPLTALIVGNPTKTYDGDADALLTPDNFDFAVGQFEGFVAGEGATVTETAGLYNSENVSEANNVTATLTAADFTADVGTLLSNYILPTSASGAGEIDPRLLTVNGVVADDKVYDGNTVATLQTAAATLVNVVAGDNVALNSDNATGTFAQADVGLDIQVTAAGFTLDNNPFGNYVLAQPTGLFADITQAEITLDLILKVYDATTGLPAASSAYTLGGVVSGDDVFVNTAGITGSYSNKNVGINIPVTLTGLALAGADAGNYLIQTSYANAPIGQITPAQLFVSITGNPTRIYDGTNAALLVPGDYTLTGFQGGEGAAITQDEGTYNSANVLEATTVTVLLALADYSPDAGTLLSNYILPTQATGAGAITPAQLAVSITGNPTRVYNGTTAALLDSGDYTLTGFVAGQSSTITETAGTYNSPNVLTATTVSASLTQADYSTGAGTLLSNYILPTQAVGAGVITPAQVAASITGNPTRVYNGTTAALLDSGDYTLTGFVSGQGATITETAGTYNSPNVVGATNVTVLLTQSDYAPDSGTLLSNYLLPNLATGAGAITPAQLAVSITGNPTRVYDGTNAALLDSGDYTLTGFVAGQGATITETAGTYNSANVLTATTVTAILAQADYSAGAGTLLSNYILPTQAVGAGAITPAQLAVSITGNPTRVYDGTTAALLDSGDYTLTGFVAGQGATITETAGTYNSPNVLTANSVTVLLTQADYAADSGTLLSNYILPNQATGAGTITRALLTASITGLPTKTYDATTTATLTPANFELDGFVAGEGATVTETAGTYDSPNADIRSITALLGIGDFSANSGTLLSNYVLPTEATGAGIILRATLTATIIGNPTRVYDGTDLATLMSGNFLLSGFVAGQGATVIETAGTYNSPNVVTANSITAALGSADFVANSGTLLTNYALPTTASGPGTITRALLTAAIIGNPTKFYDGTNAATLNPGNFQLSGFVSGQGATVTETAGLYDSPNAGSRTVTAQLGAGDFSANSGTLLSNYALPTSASGAGTIGRATLTATLTGVTKVYDGTTAATLVPGNFLLSGFVAGQGASVTETMGLFASPNAGPRTVTATLAANDFDANPGTLLANYVLPTSASGLGLIERAQLTALIVGNPTRVYDGTTLATLTSGNYQLNGFVAGQGATVTETVGIYASPNAGSRLVTASLAAGEFTANGGTLLSNYILPTSATGLGTITRADLAAAIIGNPTKVYDGTDLATLTSANFGLTGFVAGEGATVTQDVGNYASPNAGIRLVTASLAAGDFTANAGTLLSNYNLPTEASGFGLINRAALSAAIVGNPTRVYDGTDLATLTSANFALTGFVTGEGATVTETAGTYSSPNAGVRVVSAQLQTGDFAADGGTLLTNYILPTEAIGPGTIDRALLTAAIVGNPTKIYDATDLATLDASNFELDGFVEGEGAIVSQTAGTYASPDAGPRIVTASLATGDFLADSGTLLTNYVLPVEASGLGTILPRAIDARVGVTIVNAIKTYDGTTVATLTPENYLLTGFVAGEGASITETVGVYDSRNAGQRTVTALLTRSDYLANPGTNLANYLLPESANGLGTILQAPLTAAIIGNPTRVYDATSLITLDSANYQLTGFVAGEGATVTETAGLYDSPNAGARIVTAVLESGDFTADAGTLLSNYFLPTEASGPGAITPKEITVLIVGTPDKVYDGTTDVAISPGELRILGLEGSDSVSVNSVVPGEFGDQDVGLREVTISVPQASLQAAPGTVLSNYVLRGDAFGIGRITPAPLTAAIVGNPTKIYDGTDFATLASGNFQLTGFAAGEGATVTETIGIYDSPNATVVAALLLSGALAPEDGARLVTALLESGDFVPDTGTLLSNYILPTEATGPGTIDRALLTAAIVGNPTRAYDGTDLAVLTSANFALTGFIAGEGATVTETAGTYDSPNAGARTVTALLEEADFAADSGTLLTNYVLPIEAFGPGTIDPALLLATIVGNPTRAYDGTAAASLTPVNFALSGFAAGEGASVTRTAGLYNSPNVVEANSVTAQLASGDFGADAGTLLSNYVLPVEASGPGTIDPALLTASIVGNPTKFYDGNDSATLTAANYELGGFVDGQGATVTETAGNYDGPEPGDHIVTAQLDEGEFTADAGTLLSNYALPEQASGPGEILVPVDPIGPDIRAQFGRIASNIRFYIPYPTIDPMYQGHTNGFAGLPSILLPARTFTTASGIVVASGSQIVNSGEQILAQGARAKLWYIQFAPIQAVDSIGGGR